jgi:hypothetical protein
VAVMLLAEIPKTGEASDGDSGSTTSSVRLSELRVGEGLRIKTLDDEHVSRLMELEGRWGTILVWRERNAVLDGIHRMEAARRLGHRAIAVTWFYGTAEEGYVQSLQRNSRHGLPLTMGERTRAAERILENHSEWSDRRIAAVCSVSAKTVARIRRSMTQPPTVSVRPSDGRVGRDGKSRPTEPEVTRKRVIEELQRQPKASLRTVAAATGVSPETVRSVRLRLTGGTESLSAPPSTTRSTVSRITVNSDTSKGRQQSATLCTDPAFISQGISHSFAAWFDALSVGDDWRDRLEAVPLSRVYEVTDEARRRAKCWSEFASALEAKTRHQRCP